MELLLLLKMKNGY